MTTVGPGVVTFLFTDLVGSTALIDRLGDDAADSVRREHFDVLRKAVEDAGGEEVKSLGDGLMVSFASPVAALSCAVAMQRSMAEGDLRIRVGVHAGEPVHEGDDYFGTPVVVAKRLCDRADGGQILATELHAGMETLASSWAAVSRGGGDAAGLARQAISVLDGLELPLLKGRAYDVLGRALAGDDPVSAAEAFRQAIARFESCGAMWRRDRALAELERTAGGSRSG